MLNVFFLLSSAIIIRCCRRRSQSRTKRRRKYGHRLLKYENREQPKEDEKKKKETIKKNSFILLCILVKPVAAPGQFACVDVNRTFIFMSLKIIDFVVGASDADFIQQTHIQYQIASNLNTSNNKMSEKLPKSQRRKSYCLPPLAPLTGKHSKLICSRCFDQQPTTKTTTTTTT